MNKRLKRTLFILLPIVLVAGFLILRFKGDEEAQVNNKNQVVLNELRKIYRLAKKYDIALGCWCYPKRCHSETIKRFIESYL